MNARTATLAARRSVREVLPPFAVAKVLTVAAIPLSLQQATGTATWAQLGRAFQHWDAISYLGIAAHGYPAHLDYLDAFLPGYPLLIRGLTLVVADPVVAALLVSAAAELAALAAVAELVRAERDAVSARFAVWAVALAPLGFFFTGIYTESAFIGATALSLLLMRAGRVRGAALAGAFAAAMRVTGLVLVPVMMLELLRQRRRPAELAWVVVVPLPLLLYAAYMQVHIGDGLAFLHAQALPSFRESVAWPWDGLRTTWAAAVAPGDPVNRAIFQREVVFGALGFVAVVAGWLDARFPRSFALYGTLVWLMAVSITFWRSVPRYDLALFPLVLVLGDATARLRALRPALLGASAVVLMWGAWVFARGGWVG